MLLSTRSHLNKASPSVSDKGFCLYQWRLLNTTLFETQSRIHFFCPCYTRSQPVVCHTVTTRCPPARTHLVCRLELHGVFIHFSGDTARVIWPDPPIVAFLQVAVIREHTLRSCVSCLYCICFGVITGIPIRS